MRLSARNLDLPLLAKELIEQAARKRTYVIRVAYASLLFFVGCLFFFNELQAAATSPLAVLGRGKEMFATLVFTQFAGVYLFMPAITCGVLTQEKERDSLQLLLITRLGPWTILFEKLLGRLVPMLGFLMLSLPLLGFAYSLGGISLWLLGSGVWMLVLAAIQMGTLALFYSAFFRTTVAAFVATYATAFLMFFGPYVMWAILYLIGYLLGVDFDSLLRPFSQNITPGLFMLGAFPFFAPPLFAGVSFFPGGLGFWPLAVHSVMILAVSGGFLLLARRCVVARAFLPPRNYLLEFFKALDRGRRRPQPVRPATLGPVPDTDPALLPADEPIAWRELAKRALGRARYLFRLLAFIEVPLTLFCGLLIVSELASDQYYSFVPRVLISIGSLILWLLAVLIVAVQSASLIAGERSHQTLDVLCTTPLSGREIILQKFRGVRRLILVLWVPMLTVFLCEALLRTIAAERQHWAGQRGSFDSVLYLASSAAAALVYLPLVAWLSLTVGLKFKTQTRAMIGSMAAILGWSVLPLITITMPLAILLDGPQMLLDRRTCQALITGTTLFSPASIVFINETDFEFLHNEFGSAIWLPLIANFVFYGGMVLVFRAICLKMADRWLGRSQGTEIGHDRDLARLTAAAAPATD